MKIPYKLIVGICVNDPEINDVADITLENYIHALERIALHKYQVIEHTPAHQLGDDDYKRITETTLVLGMSSWSVHSDHLNSPESQAVKKYYEDQKICAHIASILGCQVMVFHPPNASLSIKKKSEIIRQVAVICEDYGLRAAMENCVLPIAELLDLFNEADHSNLGFAFDSGHARLDQDSPEGPVEVIKAMGSRIWTTHLQDNLGKRDDHLPPGLGTLDWHSILKALWNENYDGPLIVETTCNMGKIKRESRELQNIPMEVEQALGKSYLEFLHRTLLVSSSP